MLNGLLVALLLASVLVAALTGGMGALSSASLTSAKQAVELALGLVGAMTFFLGLMRVASDAGALRLLSRALAPIVRRLFPGVPPSHPAIGAMVLNVASTMLGLGNAATPFGIKAMQELDRLNPVPGTATDAMVVFLAINTAGFSILPTSILALRSAAGSTDPAGVLVGIWLASGCATIVGILAAVGLSRLPRFRAGAPIPPLAGGEGAPEEPAAEPTPLSPPRLAAVLAAAYGLAFAGALALHIVRSLADERLPGVARTVLSDWTLPALIGGVVLFGWARGANVFTSFVEGGKEGFQVAVRILPYLVVILVAVGMFRATGGLDWVVSLLDPITGRIGMPAEALPVALMRPLSASGAYGLAADAIRVHGPDSYVGLLVSTLHGSSETTFYVLAVYFGAVGVKRTRHALPACLLADVAGVASAVLVVRTRLG